MRKRKINVAMQYAVIYYTIFVVAFVCLMLLVEWSLMEYKERVINEARETAKSYINDLEVELNSWQKNAQMIYSDNLLNPDDLFENQINTLRGVEQLNLYEDTILLTDYVFVKFSTHEDVILPEGTSSLESFMRYGLQLSESSKEMFVDMVTDYDHSNSAVFDASKENNIYVQTFSFRRSFYGNKDIVGFGVSGNTLRKYLEEKLQNIPFYAVMESDDGSIIFEVNMLSNVSDISDIREQILSKEDEGIKGYCVDFYDSSYGFTYSIALEEDFLLSDFKTRMNRLLSISAIVFALVLVVLKFANKFHVKQIKKVRDGIIKLYNHDDELNSNEFLQMQEIIDKIYNEQIQKQDAKNAFDDSMSGIIAKLLLSDMLKQRGDILQELIITFCPNIENKYYAVFQVISSKCCDEIVASFSRENSKVIFTTEKDEDSNLCYLIIGIANNDADGKIRRDVAEALIQRAYHLGVRNICVTISRCCEKLYEIGTSYKEVVIMAESVLKHGDLSSENIFVFETIVRERIYEETMRVKIRSFEIALKEKNLEQTSSEFFALFKHCTEGENISKKLGIYLLAYVLGEIFRAAGYSDAKIKKIQELGFVSAESLKEYILKQIADVKSRQVVSEKNILAYINAYYKCSTISLEGMATHFNVSKPHMSRLIKESLGEGYSEYIFRIRMEEACRLLRETDISARNIVTEIGYTDYASFSNKFKLKTGVTLGEYRKKHRNVELGETE